MTLQLAAGGEKDSISWPRAAPNSTVCQEDLRSVDGDEKPGAQNSCACSATAPDHLALRTIAERIFAFAGRSYLRDDLNLQIGAYNEHFDSRCGLLLNYAYGASANCDHVASCAIESVRFSATAVLLF